MNNITHAPSHALTGCGEFDTTSNIDFPNSFVLVIRGDCDFSDKVRLFPLCMALACSVPIAAQVISAQAASAAGIIVFNVVNNNDLVIMSGMCECHVSIVVADVPQPTLVSAPISRLSSPRTTPETRCCTI